MYKKLLLFIIFFLLLFPLGMKAEKLHLKPHYYSEANHYFFTLPGDWEELPQETINDISKQATENTKGYKIVYATGFHLKNSPILQLPYILVQELGVNTPSYSQIINVYNKFSQKNNDLDKYLDSVSNATIDKPYIDKNRNIIFMNIEMDNANGERIKGLMANFLGKNNMVQLNFYSAKQNYSENVSIFNEIIDSFEYDFEYKYNEVQAKKNDHRSIFEGAAEKGVIGAITGGIIGLFFVLFNRSKKKNNKEKEK